jgi:hypothetical protein
MTPDLLTESGVGVESRMRDLVIDDGTVLDETGER